MKRVNSEFNAVIASIVPSWGMNPNWNLSINEFKVSAFFINITINSSFEAWDVSSIVQWSSHRFVLGFFGRALNSVATKSSDSEALLKHALTHFFNSSYPFWLSAFKHSAGIPFGPLDLFSLSRCHALSNSASVIDSFIFAQSVDTIW